MTHDYKKFIKGVLFFSIPLWLHIALYVLYDPFMVIYHYDNFYEEREIPLALDRDHVSTMTYVHNRENATYDSFIFGNSRSMYYPVNDWLTYLDDAAGAYHFDASAESLYGILKKMEFIDKNGDSIKNALMIVDESLLTQAQPRTDSHLFYVSPILENYAHFFGFHFTHWKSFLNLKFAYAVCDFYFSRQIKDYMVANHFMENYNVTYQKENNEVTEEDFEKSILAGNYYTPDRMQVFEGGQTPGMGASVIGEAQKQILIQIKQLLEKHHTHFKIVVSPLYDQVQINTKDLTYLQSMFGEHRVFDYSGVNAITADYRNYYEASHYRPVVAKEIMKEIYQGETSVPQTPT